MWMSSSAFENGKSPASISDNTVRSPSRIAAASLSLTMPVAPSMAAWARLASMSCAARRRSKSIEALIASMIASGPAAKRPPHIAFEVSRSVMAVRSRPLRLLASALLYAGLLAFANPAAAQRLDGDTRAGIEALRTGDLRKLTLHETALAPVSEPYTDLAGTPRSFADSNGKVRLVNFWATWCAPCRQEKPALDALQSELGGPDFEVIAIATGRNRPEAIERFNREVGVTHLATWIDPESTLARAMQVPGLPVTVILNRQGEEIGRLMGGADWNSDSARAIVGRLIAAPD
jgi:thiol-disulfide isomerase/thioredoxin